MGKPITDAFEVLLANLNSQIDLMNAAGLKIYDAENPEFFVDSVDYSDCEDKLLISFKEEVDSK